MCFWTRILVPLGVEAFQKPFSQLMSKLHGVDASKVAASSDNPEWEDRFQKSGARRFAYELMVKFGLCKSTESPPFLQFLRENGAVLNHIPKEMELQLSALKTRPPPDSFGIHR
jgi:hypothetical protein